MKDFFERAIALRDTLEQSEGGCSKDVKLNILSQFVAQVFRYRKIPRKFIVYSDDANVAFFCRTLLHELEIKVTNINFDDPSIPTTSPDLQQCIVFCERSV